MLIKLNTWMPFSRKIKDVNIFPGGVEIREEGYLLIFLGINKCCCYSYFDIENKMFIYQKFEMSTELYTVLYN